MQVNYCNIALFIEDESVGWTLMMDFLQTSGFLSRQIRIKKNATMVIFCTFDTLYLVGTATVYH